MKAVPTKFPPIPEALLKQLEKRFPDHVPAADCPIDEVRAKAGEQRVVRFLRSEFERQNKTVLENTRVHENPQDS
jgi:hypothetical protein